MRTTVKAVGMRLARGLGALTALGLSLGALEALPPATAKADTIAASQSPQPTRMDALLNRVRTIHGDGMPLRSYNRYVGAHHKLLGMYWRKVASDRITRLPMVTLMGRRGRFSGCGRVRAINAYCPESNEIILSTKGMKRTQRFSDANHNLLALTVLAHEWGHHVNNYAGRGGYSKREEDAADWRAGRYLAWLMQNDAIGVKEFTDAANLFFSIGDFHFDSPHNNPKARYEAFIAGVAEEVNEGLTVGDWVMDTPETFSRVIKSKGNRKDGVAGPKKVIAKVYRFEIERAGQVAGNVFNAVMGVVECGTGSSGSCANALRQQGKAKPDGWYRLRTVEINCEKGNFDIEDDGIRRQPLKGDRKKQAVVIAQRACSTEEEA